MRLWVHVRANRDAGRVLAYCPHLPGCSASAPTEEQALALVRRRVRDCLRAGRSDVPPGAWRRQIEV